MGKRQSLRSKAAHIVSDLTTVFLNPISDKPPPKPSSTRRHPNYPEDQDVSNSRRGELGLVDEVGPPDCTVDVPDTSSFSAFLYSFLSSSESENSKSNEKDGCQAEDDGEPMHNAMKETVGKKGLFSRGKQTMSKALYQAARISGYRNQERKGDSNKKSDDINDVKFSEVQIGEKINVKEPVTLIDGDLSDASERSFLLSEKTRSSLYASLPSLVHGRKWLLLYSTWRHGISLSTLYRRSMLWSGLSLLVVGDRKGAVFGGLVESPLRPTNKRYQGTNDTFVFTNTSGHPVIYRPTGTNRYFTLCSTDFLAIGGGGHFALYLDGDLLNGSSSVSETYGNPCLANSVDFEVKEVELWGFVYASKYEEMLATSRIETPGISHW